MSKPQIHILLVEDDIVDRMACRRALAQDPSYEFVLSEAETGRQGLQLAHEQKPDCVLLDYHLPDLDGLEFLTELKNDVGEITVPVMMLTGSDNASVAVEALKRGAQDYLVKDANRQYLVLLSAVIERVLRERKMLMEKKQVEENLVRAEAMYRFLVEQIPAITYTTALDASGKLLYISPQIRQLGFSPEELLAEPEGLLKHIYPEDRTLVYTSIAGGYEGEQPVRCEHRLLTRDGEVRWFLNEASLVRHESGEPMFMQGILVDITKDKEVEEELHQHRRRLEELVTKRTMQFEKQTSILESANANLTKMLGECKQAGSALKKNADRLLDIYHNAPCGYHSLDADGVFVQINDTELKWHELKREEVVGKARFGDLLTPESGKVFADSYSRLKESGRISNLELEIARRDGTRQHILLSANALKNAEGQFVTSRSILFDITDR